MTETRLRAEVFSHRAVWKDRSESASFFLIKRVKSASEILVVATKFYSISKSREGKTIYCIPRCLNTYVFDWIGSFLFYASLKLILFQLYKVYR